MTKTASIRSLAALSLALLAGGAWATEPGAKAKPVRAAEKAPAVRSAPADVGAVRDWSQIDLNKDNLISPDEMEAELSRGKSTTKQ